ncbi:MAG: hypothetical protein IJ794_12830 [Lachnospiraceae bacterium]|nr:hypothetical protein [Lachnospiraceae bacterium]MBR1854005.1 hypothetical protein [Lachnospiraceae bacterium]
MYEYDIDESNSLKEEITELLSLCERYDEENDGEYSYFDPAISEEDMINWERENNASIPESYKEWLRFTGKCRIAQNTAMFWDPSGFNSDFVEEDMVVIGELIGDGERVCFSKTTGEMMELFEGRSTVVEGFGEVLSRIIRMLDDQPILSKERYEEILKELQADREAGRI